MTENEEACLKPTSEGKEATSQQLVEAADMLGGLFSPIIDRVLEQFPKLTKDQLYAVVTLGIKHAFGARAQGGSRPTSERLLAAHSWKRGKKVFCVSRNAVFLGLVTDSPSTPENPYASIFMDGVFESVPLLLLSSDPSDEHEVAFLLEKTLADALRLVEEAKKSGDSGVNITGVSDEDAQLCAAITGWQVSIDNHGSHPLIFLKKPN